jgi:hypothetical protein
MPSTGLCDVDRGRVGQLKYDGARAAFDLVSRAEGGIVSAADPFTHRGRTGARLGVSYRHGLRQDLHGRGQSAKKLTENNSVGELSWLRHC